MNQLHFWLHLTESDIQEDGKKKQTLLDCIKSNYEYLESGDLMDQEDVELIVDKVLTYYYNV